MHLDNIKVLLPTDTQENCFKKSIKIYIKIGPTSEFYLPTDAQINCLKNNFQIYIKIYI